MALSKSTYLCLILFFTPIFLTPLLGAEPIYPLSVTPQLDHSWRKNEYTPSAFIYGDTTNENPRIYQEVDVLHYIIDADFYLGDSPYPDNAYLEAVATISAQTKAETLDEIIIDFYDNISINSFILNGVEFSSYTRSDDKIWLDLSSDPLQPGEGFEIIVDYSHVYGGVYQGLMFRKHGDSDTPAICSIDQPYQSPGWWPCFDYPSDKATADIYITCPDWMTAVSNGLLQEGYPLDNGDGTKTWYWREEYSIYTSALSVAMTDYVTWDDTYISPLDGTEMPLVYYAFPEDAEKAMVDYDVTKDALVYFAQIYGEYPFIDEKYGIAETPNPFGSLEHQTITSLTYRATQREVNWDVIVHEAAHQWWGDWVTGDTWNHLWLHEGFATYSEVLFHEYATGESAGVFLAVNYDDGLYDGKLDGTVYVEDEDLSNPFSNLGDIYDKGAWVLHMLRQIMGDASFFTALKTFGQAHAFSTAVTDDLKDVMEAQYGSSLEDFFDQWVYTPYRPIYQYEFESSPISTGGYLIDVQVNQLQEHKIKDLSGEEKRDYYIMPLDLTLHFNDGTEQTFTVYNDHRQQRFQLKVDKEPTSLELDQDYKILKVKETPITDIGENALPTAWGIAFPPLALANMPVALFGLGQDQDGSITQYNWIIDNKKTIEGPLAITSFQESGQHQVSLTVEDNLGGAGSSIPIFINVL